jgi:predicted AAA+ superfamily ATPase
MENIVRQLQLKKGSYLILGPRQSGKSTWIRFHLANSAYFEYDLLKRDIYKRYLNNPEQLREDIVYLIKEKKINIVFIDEIQRIPELFDIVHDLIETFKIVFYLSGSSSRKFKAQGVNLLGGRAKLSMMFPFTFHELKDQFKLENVLQFGSLAGIYFKDDDEKEEYLRSYVELYIKEEILQESLVRKIQDFHRFLDIAAIYAAQILSYTNIAREVQIAEGTVKSYFQIIEDTLIGYKLPAWDISVKKQLSKHPKFYFFDNGINNALLLQLKGPLHPEQRGHLFEQWFVNEIRAFMSYNQLPFHLHFWRTSDGHYEVDLILSKSNKIFYAIEIKGKKILSNADFKSLKYLKSEHPHVKCFLVSEVSVSSIKDEIVSVNWKEFLNFQLKKILEDISLGPLSL